MGHQDLGRSQHELLRCDAVDLPTYYGSHATVAGAGHAVFSERDGSHPAAVRFLGLCRTTHCTLAILRISTGNA